MLLNGFIKFLILLICVLISVAFFTLLERKVLGYMQIRKGPNKLGIKGVLQPFSDALKLLSKEPTYMKLYNFLPYLISPLLSLVIMLSLWMVFCAEDSVLVVKLSVVFFMLCLSAGVYPSLISGWASNSKYSFLGSLRSGAQVISYEVSLAILLLSFMIFFYSLDLESLSNESFIWMVFFSPFLAVIWGLTTLAETNRTPFDLSEGESELVSGFNTEYSSGGFTLFFLSEYGSMLFMSFVFVLVFLTSGFGFQYLSLKIMLVAYMFVWVRGSLPRMRYDKLMKLTWKVFLPVALFYFLFMMSIMSVV